MRQSRSLIVAALACLTTMTASLALASSPVPVPFGASWDPPAHSLQNIVDAYLGTAGAINVQTDYIGAHAGDPDPWFWIGSGFPALLVSEVAGNANVNTLGWYAETGSVPVIDGVGDGVVFSGSQGAGSSTVVVMPGSTIRFGFYLDPAPESPASHQRFFTNRFLNDLGPQGAGAVHAPFDGDVQAIVFDVSRWKGPDTWLVCFEDLDAGNPITPCCTGTDDDYNDMVFQVSALGATPVRALSFGELKLRFGGR
ncbi:MAG: hypothetical protein IT347_09870 [Candidatus Eisenbacteria bacterium]|nr:hypothetical protein [Candidatus Eisenbacteria bacterium]